MSAPVPRMRLMESASFKSKTPRDSYMSGVKRASHDAPSPDVKPPTPRGGATACFRSSTPRGSESRSLQRQFVDAQYALKSDFDPKPSHSVGPSAAFKGKTGRDSYIKGTHQVSSTSYDVPGIAEEVARRKTGGWARGSTCPRDSYITALKGRFGVSSAEVPGIAEESKRRSGTPSAAFRGKAGTGRDSYLVDAKCRSFSPAPTLKGIAEQVAERKTGKFLGGDGRRDGYLRSGQKCLVDASYDIPGFADKPDGVISSRSCFTSTADRYSYARDQRKGKTDLYYDVPGLADSLKSPSSTCAANAAFRAKSPRHGYIPKSPQTNDISYDVPGMADLLLRSPKGKINQGKSVSRDSHIKASQKFVDATYDIPGMAELNGSFALSNPSMNNSMASSSPPPSRKTPTRSR